MSTHGAFILCFAQGDGLFDVSYVVPANATTVQVRVFLNNKSVGQPFYTVSPVRVFYDMVHPLAHIIIVRVRVYARCRRLPCPWKCVLLWEVGR